MTDFSKTPILDEIAADDPDLANRALKAIEEAIANLSVVPLAEIKRLYRIHYKSLLSASGNNAYALSIEQEGSTQVLERILTDNNMMKSVYLIQVEVQNERR